MESVGKPHHIVADRSIPYVERAFGHVGRVTALPTPAITTDSVGTADILVLRSETKVNGTLLENSRVRFVGTVTIGFDHLDTDYLRERGIQFASAPGSNADAVAEYVAAALLTLARQKGFLLHGRTLGVVGVGNVGSRVVRVGEALGMRVLQNDPPLARKTGEERFLPLEALMEADVLTLHVPLTRIGEDPTHHLFDGARLAQLKSGLVLINTSRGAVVETEALKDTLLNSRLSAAILDVWENEPIVDGELLDLTQIATPHIAGHSLDGKVNGLRMIHEAVCRFLGVPITWDIDDELPRPEVERIVLDEEMVDLEPALLHVIQHCYDIESDDSLLRGMLEMPENVRAAYFTGLRAQYRVRREFKNTTVEVPANRKEIQQALTGLGFKTLTIEAGKVGR